MIAVVARVDIGDAIVMTDEGGHRFGELAGAERCAQIIDLEKAIIAPGNYHIWVLVMQEAHRIHIVAGHAVGAQDLRGSCADVGHDDRGIVAAADDLVARWRVAQREDG